MMIKKKWAVWVVVLIAVGVVTASTLTTLEPGTLSDKNISFASAGSNSTNYIQLPSNASVSLATMNVTGYINNIDDDSEDSYSCAGDWDVSYPCSNAVDENFSTSGSDNTYTIAEASIYENYTIPTLITSANWTFKLVVDNDTGDYFNVSCWNYSGTTWYQMDSYNNVIPPDNKSIIIPSDCLNNILQVRTLLYDDDNGAGYKVVYYEGKAIWSSYSSNATIDISNDGDVEFNQSGTFNTENTTSDFTSELNDALNGANCDCSGCTITGSYCQIALNVSTDTGGIIELSNLNVTYGTIPNEPTLNSPTNGTINQPLSVDLNITVTDVDGDDMNVSFYTKGFYSSTSNWECVGAVSNIYDNDLTTCAHPGKDIGPCAVEPGSLYINYTKPTSATSSSLWNIKDSDGTANLTITSCWSESPLKFKLDFTSHDLDWQCYNGSDWETLQASSGGYFSTIYACEETMLWNISSLGEMSSTSTNISNGSYANYTWSGLLSGTNYEWYASITDGYGTRTSSTYNFTQVQQLQ